MKIAVITQEDHSTIGGIEKVHRLIYDLFDDKHTFTEFPTLEDPRYRSKKVHKLNPKVTIDNRLLGWKPYVIIYGGSYTKKNFNYLNDNFDLVLVGSSNAPKRWIKNEKFVLWQHMNWDFYGIGGKPLLWSTGQVFSSIFFGAGSFRSMFKWAKTSMFYAPETSIPTKGKQFYAPLSAYPKKDIKDYGKKRTGFVWFARLVNAEKGVKAIIDLANLNKQVTIYGGGKDEKMINKKLNNQKQFKGYIKNTDVPKMLQQKKAMIMTSNFEGFGLTVVEALSQGTPVVMFDTFDAAKYFETSGAVFLFKKGDIQGLNNKLNELDELSPKQFKELSNKAVKFAKENLSIEAFKNNVEKLFNNFDK